MDPKRELLGVIPRKMLERGVSLSKRSNLSDLPGISRYPGDHENLHFSKEL
jgi:hypothetical protein